MLVSHPMKSVLYFDYNATAPLSKAVIAKLPEWVAADYKNPSSAHAAGREAKNQIEKARKQILTLLGAKEKDRLIFTSGGTEANNTVIESAFKQRKNRNKYVLTNVEHSSVNRYAKELEARGVELVFINIDKAGSLDLNDFKTKLTPDVFLVSVMFAQNETGFIFPIQELAQIARAAEIPFHCDAVCATGKVAFNFNELGVDFLTFSSHKFGGLKGAGGIVCRREAILKPLVLGGPHEAEKRAGTENVFGMLSSCAALEESLNGVANKTKKIARARERLQAGIMEAYPQAKFIESKTNLPGTLSVNLAPHSGQVLLTNLDLEGVAASYGSACASGSLELSRVILAIGLSRDEAGCTLRFSFGAHTDDAVVDEFITRFKTVMHKMSIAA